MNRLLAVLALAALAPATAQAGPPGPDALLARMAALNPDLHSFTATLHAQVTMKSFPFISTELVGTYYHKEPSMDKVVFSSGLPMVAQEFDKLYAHIPSPSLWEQTYAVTIVSDDGGATALRLVPRKKGNVDHIDAKVDDETATVTSLRWNYDNGGYAEMNNTWSRVDGHTLVTAQTGTVKEPVYSAEISSTLDNYTINPPLTDDMFTQ